MRSPGQDAIVRAALFTSGAAALIYQVCWIRTASLIFGSTTFAVSTVFAVFFLGLAIGSFVFGRVARETHRPLRLFGVLEVALGVFALATPVLFHAADGIYGVAYRAMPDAPWLLGIVRTTLVGLVIVPATVLMGGTLPLVTRRYAAAALPVNRSVGVLYGLNTLGAAAGAGAAGFLMLPSLGLRLTSQAAAALSIAGGVAVALLPIARNPAAAPDPPPALVRSAGERTWPLLFLYFGVGFVALGLEVVWFRFLSLIIRNTVYTYTLVLTVMLLGIVLGSWLAARLAGHRFRCAIVFGWLQILSALCVLALMMLPPAVWRSLDNELWICALLLLVPSVLGGASFPLAVRLVAADANAAAFGAGLAAAVNTLGGVLGSLVLGFLVLPYWGLETAIRLTTALGLIIGSATLIGLARMRTSAVAIAGAVWLGIAVLADTEVPADFLTESGGRLVDYREGFSANLALIEQDGVTRLEIDRWWQGETRRTHQALSAHVPTLLHPDARSVLLVGVGMGQTAVRFLMHDIERLDCVDIEPALFDFVGRRLESPWMTDPRTQPIVEDGRAFLRHGPARYDIISLELGQPFRPGVAYFYTHETYGFARARLNPKGLTVQFVPLAFFEPEQFRQVVRTFLDVFPQSVLWYNSSEVLLVGVNGSRFPWPASLTSGERLHPKVLHDLDFAYWGGAADVLNRPEVFLGGFLAGPEDLARFADAAPILRDDRPMLDYATARVNAGTSNEIANARAIRDHLSPLPAELASLMAPAVRDRAAAIQARNAGDIAAAALVREAGALEARGDADGAIGALRQSLEWNEENVQAHLRLGDLLLRRGAPDLALRRFATAARILPNHAGARHGLAMCLHRTGRIGEAISQYQQAVPLDPANAELRNNYGAALAELGRYEDAHHQFREAVRLRPGYADAQRNLEAVEGAR